MNYNYEKYRLESLRQQIKPEQKSTFEELWDEIPTSLKFLWATAAVIGITIAVLVVVLLIVLILHFV